MKTLLAAVDLEAGSRRVVQRAVALASSLGAELHLIHVIDEAMVLYEPMIEISVRRRLKQGAEQAMEALLEGLPLAQIPQLKRHVVLGKPDLTLARKASELKAELVIAGQHHLEPMQELFLGTTVERLLRHCTMPVLVVASDQDEPYQRLVAATDFSLSSHHALGAALALAPDADISLVHVFEPPALLRFLRQEQPHTDSLMAHQKQRIEQEVREEMSHFLQAGERDRVTTRIMTGDIHQQLTQAVQQTGAQLLALGYHGRQGLSRLLIGNLAMSFLSAPPCDVLITR